MQTTTFCIILARLEAWPWNLVQGHCTPFIQRHFVIWLSCGQCFNSSSYTDRLITTDLPLSKAFIIWNLFNSFDITSYLACSAEQMLASRCQSFLYLQHKFLRALALLNIPLRKSIKNQIKNALCVPFSHNHYAL